MTAAPDAGGRPDRPPRPRVADRFCDAVDALNAWAGLLWGLTVLFVTAAVVYEIVLRGVFNRPTIWSNEAVIYVSAMTYLIAGGYALLHRAHVRIDVLYERFTAKTRARLDLFTFIFFVLYVGTLIWGGTASAWMSYGQAETTGTPWNPPIWPVKFTIPLAGVLLLLQGVANLLRDLGVARPKVAP